MSKLKKAKVKLNLKNSSLEKKVGLAKLVVQSISDNKYFNTPIPSLSSVTDAITAAEAAYADLKQTKQMISIKMSVLNDRTSELEGALKRLGSYVNSIANGDAIIIKSAGLSIAAPSISIGMPSAPENLQASAMKEHEMELSWKAVKGAKTYVVQLSTDVSSNQWDVATVSTKSWTTIKNLVSGKKYWFRVAAVGAAGQSNWSDPATKYAI